MAQVMYVNYVQIYNVYYVSDALQETSIEKKI